MAAPALVTINAALAQRLGLDPEQLRSNDYVQVFAGNRLLDGGESIAQAYAGHQFGHFVPSLGDGRALLLGEQITPGNERFDIQLKGSGQTPFSRRGDGRAALGPMMREYMVGEALNRLGIPSTRALALVTTGEPVYRETVLPGAIVTRVARSHIRVGTFEYFSARGDTEAISQLADYTIARHYPECGVGSERYQQLLNHVSNRQASLVAQWLLVGFVHGVMNTDNVALSGESIDFGPCAFIDTYHPDAVFSSIDAGGRYAFGAQPRVLQWNLARFAETLLPLLAADADSAVAIAEQSLAEFPALVQSYWTDGMRAKLGFNTHEDGDTELIRELLGLMRDGGLDYCTTFRALSSLSPHEGFLSANERQRQWHQNWQARIQPERNNRALNETSRQMQVTNPARIARNYLVEEAISAGVERGDFSVMEKLVEVLENPFEDRAEYTRYNQPPPASWKEYRTFCGT